MGKGHRIKRILITDPTTTTGVSFLEIEDHDVKAHPPIEVDAEAADRAAEANYIALIGFPGGDAGVPHAYAEALLGDAPGVKRVMPLRILVLPKGMRAGGLAGLAAGRLAFEGSTLALTDSGPVMDLHSGKLIGMNIARPVDPTKLNARGWAIPVSQLLADETVAEAFRNAASEAVTFDTLAAKAMKAARPPAAGKPKKAPAVAARPVDGPAAAPAAPAGPGGVGSSGYDPAFLPQPVPLPRWRGDAAGASPNVLNYDHMSAVMNAERRLARFVAANADGADLVGLVRPRGWFVDPRIGPDQQTDPGLYPGNDLDRGHLVSPRFVNWGSKAELGMRDAYSYAVTVPQHQDLNRGAWLQMEKFLLDYIETEGIKASVFAGPVFRDDDPEYRGIRLPQAYWLILAVADKEGQPRVAAFLLRQEFVGVPGAGDHAVEVPPFDPIDSRASLATIEKLTGLSFGDLRDAPDLF